MVESPAKQMVMFTTSCVHLIMTFTNRFTITDEDLEPDVVWGRIEKANDKRIDIQSKRKSQLKSCFASENFELYFVCVHFWICVDLCIWICIPKRYFFSKVLNIPHDLRNLSHQDCSHSPIWQEIQTWFTPKYATKS